MLAQGVHAGKLEDVVQAGNKLKGVVPGRPEKAAMLVRNDAVFIEVQEGGWAQRLKAEEGTARAWPPLNAPLGSATCAQDNS